MLLPKKRKKEIIPSGIIQTGGNNPFSGYERREVDDVRDELGFNKDVSFAPPRPTQDQVGVADINENVLPVRTNRSKTADLLSDIPDASPSQTYQDQIKEKQLRKDTIQARMEDPNDRLGKNNDRGIKGRLWDIAREAILGIGAVANSGRTDLGSLLGGAAGGAMVGGFDPSIDERRAVNNELREIDEGIIKMRDYQKQEQEARMRAAQIAIAQQKPQIEAQKQALAVMKERNQHLYDNIMSDDIITEEETNLARQLGYNIVPTDARKLKETENGGVIYRRPEKGDYPYRPDPSQPINQSKVIRKRTFQGKDYYLDDKSAAAFDRAIANQNASRALSVAMANNRTENEYIRSLDSNENKDNADFTKWNQDFEQARADVDLYAKKGSQLNDKEIYYSTEINKTEQRINHLLNNYDMKDDANAKAEVSYLRSQLTSLKSNLRQTLTAKSNNDRDYSKAKSKYEGLQKNKPKERKTRKRKTIDPLGIR